MIYIYHNIYKYDCLFVYIICIQFYPTTLSFLLLLIFFFWKEVVLRSANLANARTTGAQSEEEEEEKEKEREEPHHHKIPFGVHPPPHHPNHPQNNTITMWYTIHY